MGKSEILMLLAGVALSVMLAMVAVPMFSSGNEMADRQQVQQDLMSIKSSIPLILALEGNTSGNFKSTNIAKHVTGFSQKVAPAASPDGGTIVNTKNLGSEKETTYKITDGVINGEVTILVTSPTSFDLKKLTRLDSICDKGYTPHATNAYVLTCKIER